MSKGAKYIISGGGSGGHIFPAIAIANALKLREPDAAILFVGALGKMEMEKVPAAGYNIVGLPIAGLQRGSILKNLLLPFKLVFSVLKAIFIVAKFKPNAAIGVGGYASGPLLFAAWICRVPTIIQEQNAVAGLTNRILSRFATVICVAYDELIDIYKGKNVVKTGNPVRKNISAVNISSADALRKFGFDVNKKTVLVVGGSLGAGTLNKALKENIDVFVKNDWQLIWQTGKVYFDTYKDVAKNIPTVHTTMFIEDMQLAYTAADVVLSRAGALAIAELQLVGKPTIFVPSPNVTDDQQTKNVLALESKDAAIYIKDNEISAQLIAVLSSLFSDEKRAKSLAENLKQMAIDDADEQIVNQIMKVRR